jgi:hypothetical protein
MERRLNKKAETYVTTFKDDIRERATQLNILKNEGVNQLIQYIYDYNRLSFGKEDFQKRKRVKNFVPVFDRCCAKRASCEQCTRRKKEGSDCCGTHCKGIPHGVISDLEQVRPHTKVEVWAEDFNGIVHYIDSQGNVYKTEDVLKNKPNPTIYAKWTKEGGVYSIKAS